MLRMIPWDLRFGWFAVLCVLTAGFGSMASATPASTPPFDAPPIATPPVNGVPATTPPVDAPPFITPPAGIPSADPANGDVPPVYAPVDFEKEDGHIRIEITHPRSDEFGLTGAFLSVQLNPGDGEGPVMTHADVPFPALETAEIGEGDFVYGDFEALFGGEAAVLESPVLVTDGGERAGSTSIVVNPEPATGLLLGVGLAALALGRRRKTR